jgi:hypothetical protein
MYKPQRWNDWFLLAAILCFVGALLGNLILLLLVERPTAIELQNSYQEHGGSGPGHYFAVGAVAMARAVLSGLGIFLGSMLCIAGSVRIPRAAVASRKLRDSAWITMIVALVGCSALAIL